MKNKKSKGFNLLIFYKGFEGSLKKDKQIEKLMGESKSSSGYHFSTKERDIVFHFDTIKEANKAEKKLKELDWLNRVEIYESKGY